MTEYGYTVEVPEGYDEAVVRARLAFKGEGFSIVTESHVGGLLGPEAGEGRQYLIMGAWNASAYDRDLGSDLQVAVHLPCNVVVQEVGSSAVVAVLDPVDALEGEATVPTEVAIMARDAVQRALQRVESPV
jgi:uncharacterized protein (DUF302 family)